MEPTRAKKEREVTLISADEVNRRMDKGELLYILDTRSQDAWNKGVNKLPGAIRVPPDQVDKHLADVPHDRTIITYCT